MNAPRIDLTQVELFRLRLSDVELLQNAGVLDGQKVELIDGVLIAVSPQLRPHSFIKNELTFRLRLALIELGSHLLPQSEVTIEITPETAPEPDVTLTDAPMGEGYVPVASVALAIEVAGTSLAQDLGRKRDLYAAAGIPEYWVVDMASAQVHRFADPRDGTYTAAPPIPLAGPLASLTIAGLAIDGTHIL